jgi:hypothetical protein
MTKIACNVVVALFAIELETRIQPIVEVRANPGMSESPSLSMSRGLSLTPERVGHALHSCQSRRLSEPLTFH